MVVCNRGMKDDEAIRHAWAQLHDVLLTAFFVSKTFEQMLYNLSRTLGAYMIHLGLGLYKHSGLTFTIPWSPGVHRGGWMLHIHPGTWFLLASLQKGLMQTQRLLREVSTIFELDCRDNGALN